MINNAGIIRRADAIDFSEKDWDDVMNVNLKTVFFFSQAAAKQFVKQKTGGKIINIASMLSFQGGIRVPSYTASKSGVMGITRLMANEWAKYNININAIAPGYMATDNTAALRKDPIRSKEILERIPAGRWGMPDDLKGIAVFLASEASNYINGYTIAVDGGGSPGEEQVFHHLGRGVTKSVGDFASSKVLKNENPIPRKEKKMKKDRLMICCLSLIGLLMTYSVAGLAEAAQYNWKLASVLPTPIRFTKP